MSKDLRLVFSALVVAVAAVLVTPFMRDLAVGDETKYGQVVREMRMSGAWFLPTLNGTPFTHKPPLHFWMIDALTHVFGVYSMWSFVLPSFFAFVFLMWIIWRMGGGVAAFICGTSLMIWVSAQTARMDVSFTAFLTLAIWMFQKRNFAWCGIFLGIATLIKGPMAPVIMIALFLFEWWRLREVPRGNYLAGIAAMIVIPLVWFVPAMMMGGDAYTHEVIAKQTVGRAFASWVHRAPPWYYLLHMPGVLFPWFFAAVVAIRSANRFYLTWIAAVLVPYTLMSSKLDVYMMALIPPVALMIKDVIDRNSVRIANIATLAVLAIAGIALPFIKIPYAISLRGLAIVLVVTSIVAIVMSLRSPLASTLALGLTPVVVLVFIAVTLMPAVNDTIISTRPLIASLQKQNVPPEQMALYFTPELWSRDFPRELERVRYVDADNVGDAALIATSRAHAADIAPLLRGYHRVDQVQMIGKWFDVYRK
jgi:4-amino-4-deoxy-L-arabinose transferase-like glycosyltransferase